MMRSQWLYALRHWLSSPRNRTPALRRPRFHTRPWLEYLEDRVVPADLVITKAGPPTVVAGAPLTYTLSVTNTLTSSNATAIAITDALPAGLTLTSATQTGGPDTFTNATSGNTADFTAPTMGPLNTDVFAIVATAGSALANASTLNNTASYTDTATPGGSNSNTASTTVTTAADLAVVKAGPSVITAGTTITYTLTASNLGPSDSQSVTVSDALPAGLTLVSQTQLSGPDAFAPVSNGNAAAFFAATMGAGHTDTFAVVAFAASNLVAGSTLSDTAAIISALTPDPDPSNNTSTFSSSVTQVGGTTTLAVVPPPVVTFHTGPQSLTLNATVSSSGGPVNTGTVTFTVAGQTVRGPVSNGLAEAAVTLPAGLHVGTYPISAQFVDPSGRFTSSSGSGALTVLAAPTTTAFTTVTITPSFGKATETLTAQVSSPSGPVNEGTVLFDPADVLATAAVHNGIASVTLTLPASLAAGNQIITANYSDSAGNLGASQTGPRTVFLTLFNSFFPTTVQFTPGGGQVVTTDPFGMPLVSTYHNNGHLARANWDSLLFLLLLLGF
jgi:uncharacterized repeat protein (TIGR01451 family)